MKNKVFAVIIAIMLVMPVCVFAETEPNLPDTLQNVAENASTNIENAENVDIEEKDNIQEVKTDQPQEVYKKPISKKKIAKKFIFAMLGVAFSSIFIFVLLTLYNKIREKLTNGTKTPDCETTLQSPEDIVNAVKIFLEKNK